MNSEPLPLRRLKRFRVQSLLCSVLEKDGNQEFERARWVFGAGKLKFEL
jgi:hypothetical protein